MRNRLILIALSMLLLSGGATLLHAQDGISLLPDNTQGVMTIKNLKQMYSKLGIDELRAERPDDFGFLSEESIEDMGIDLLDPAALEAEGFDMGRPLYVGILTESPAVVVLVPGKGNARTWVRAKMEEQGVRFTREEKVDGVTIDGGEADEVACFERQGYVGIVVTNHEEGGRSAVETARDLLKSGGQPVTSSPTYRKTMARLPSGADVTFYMGPNLRSQMSSWGRSDEDLAEYGLTRDDMASWERDLGFGDAASGFALSIAPDRLTVDGYSWLGKDAKARAWLVVDNDPVTFLKRTPSEPWLAMMTRMDMGALWTALQPLLERTRGDGDDARSISDGFEKFKGETGVDVEADIIRQMRGNMGLLVSRAAIMGTDLVLLEQVRDPAKFQATVDKLTAVVREEMEKKEAENPDSGRPQTQIVEDMVGGIRVYRVSISPMAELVYGMVEDHFVAASSSLRFEEIVTGGRGFAESIGSEPVRAALADPKGNVFYIDFRALSRDAEGILPMLGPKGMTISQVLAELSELAVTSRVDDEGVVQVTTLSGTRPGIWKYLIGLAVDRVERIPD